MEKESSSKNKHGLSRAISFPVQREIRQRCGFGCVRCGSAIYQYEHLDPPYSDAKSHDPDKITLLCGGCHDKVTRKFLSKGSVAKDNANPFCKRQGFTSEWFDVGVGHPSITIGGTTLTSCDEILSINNEIILGIEPPEESGSPYRISGKFYSEDGSLLFEIDRNEFKGSLEAWDIETKGGEIIVRTGARKIALHLKVTPPKSLEIKRLLLGYQGVFVDVKEDSTQVRTASGRLLQLDPSNVVFDTSCKVFGIQVQGDEVKAFGLVGGAATLGGGHMKIENLTIRTKDVVPALPPPIQIDKSLSVPIQIANARFAWSAICQKASIDPNSKTVSIDTIFGTVKVTPQQPEKLCPEPVWLPLKATFVVQWERYDVSQQANVHARLSVQRGDFCYRLSPPYFVNLIEQKTFCHLEVFDQFAIKGPGTYELVTEVRESNSAVWHVVGISLLTIEFDKEDPSNLKVKKEPESV